jgi:hypothetical protein
VLWIQYGEETGPLRFDVTIRVHYVKSKAMYASLEFENNIRNVSYRIPNNFCVTVSGGHRVEPLPPVLQSPGVLFASLSGTQQSVVEAVTFARYGYRIFFRLFEF